MENQQNKIADNLQQKEGEGVEKNTSLEAELKETAEVAETTPCGLVVSELEEEGDWEDY